VFPTEKKMRVPTMRLIKSSEIIPPKKKKKNPHKKKKKTQKKNQKGPDYGEEEKSQRETTDFRYGTYLLLMQGKRRGKFRFTPKRNEGAGPRGK